MLMVVLQYVIQQIDKLRRDYKMEKSVDEEVIFLDGARLPCVLVENKID